MKPSALQIKTYAFAVRIVRMYQFLSEEKKEFILSKQVIRSGTSIGANVAESVFARSTADFLAKLTISAKEGHETAFRLRLVRDTDYISLAMYDSINGDLDEVQRLLTSSIKTTRQSLQRA